MTIYDLHQVYYPSVDFRICYDTEMETCKEKPGIKIDRFNAIEMAAYGNIEVDKVSNDGDDVLIVPRIEIQRKKA